jgi:AcrR family transcriptional regulator
VLGVTTDEPRGEQTRRLVVDTAVRLFREQGYEKTTMRAIAQAAGLAVGNAYYYFPSKDHLVQEFYRRIQDEHLAACAPALAATTDFAGRLHAVLTALVDVMSPYHAFAGRFFTVAADPDSPLSPFSDESRPARETSQSIYRSLVEGSSVTFDPELAEALPELLWLAQLGVTLFWVHDRSPGQAKTRVLIDRAVPLIDRLVALSRLRVLRPVTREILSLYRTLSAAPPPPRDPVTPSPPPSPPPLP